MSIISGGIFMVFKKQNEEGGGGGEKNDNECHYRPPEGGRLL